MKVLSIVSQKGGTGKTTLATHLSVEAERNGQTTALIDLDPQASAAKWGDHRQADPPAVVATPASRLKHWLEIAENNAATLAIIDTPPNTESSILQIAKVLSLITSAFLSCYTYFLLIITISLIDLIDISQFFYR